VSGVIVIEQCLFAVVSKQGETVHATCTDPLWMQLCAGLGCFEKILGCDNSVASLLKHVMSLRRPLRLCSVVSTEPNSTTSVDFTCDSTRRSAIQALELTLNMAHPVGLTIPTTLLRFTVLMCPQMCRLPVSSCGTPKEMQSTSSGGNLERRMTSSLVKEGIEKVHCFLLAACC